MNQAVLDFLASALDRSAIDGRTVLEVGSLDVNGSARAVIGPLCPSSYTGVDIQAGQGVDRVVSVSFLTDVFGPESFDVVVSTEMLEHVQDWRWGVTQLKRVTVPGGRLVLTTRSPGFHHHGYPHDFWRFTEDDIRRIFADMDDVDVRSDPSSPGVFVSARRPDDLVEIDLSLVHVGTSPPPPDGPLVPRLRRALSRRVPFLR
jgi:SAM-dependent methyltransferase